MPVSLAPQRHRVGDPIHEQRLTDAVVRGAWMLLGADRVAEPVTLREVELGIGRPDVILLATDPDRLTLRRTAGLRLRTLSEALVLQAESVDQALRNGGVNEQRIARRLADIGWFEPGIRDPIVETSLILEAKVSAWRKGVRQLSRVRWAAHRAAVVVPSAVARRVALDDFRRPAAGVVSVSDDGSVSWRRKAPTSDLPFYADAWLAELAIRSVEAG